MTEPHVTAFIPESLWQSFVNMVDEDGHWALVEDRGVVFVLRRLTEDGYRRRERGETIGVGQLEPIGVGLLGEQLETELEFADPYDNDESYTPPCCRPGGRCTTPSSPGDQSEPC
jgi:hypothetical protein